MVAMTLAAILLLGGCAATQVAMDWVSGTIGGSAAGSQQSAALPAPRYLSETPARIVTPRPSATSTSTSTSSTISVACSARSGRSR